MDVKALQARLRAFAAERDWLPLHSPKNLAMALMVEAAGLLELFQWLTTAQSHTFTKDPHDKERAGDGMADVLLYLLQLADHTGVDLAEAVEHKLRKNAVRHPPKNSLPVSVVAPTPIYKVHLLVDWENVQPRGADLRALVPEGTDVWLFHGPQQKVDRAHFAAQYPASQVTLVPSARAGKNALDFHLTYYIGYIAARQQDATFVVVSNDAGYDPMLEHSRLLGFSARRQVFQRMAAVPVVVNVAPAVADPTGTELAAKIPVAKAPAQEKTQAPVKTQVHAVPPAVSASAKASAAPEQATRQDMQALVRFLQHMKPSDRPLHRGALLAVIKAQLGESSAHAPRVTHALAQLQAQQWVVLKGDGVGYSSGPKAAQALFKAAPVKKKAVTKPAVKTVATPVRPATPAIKQSAAKKKGALVKSGTAAPPSPPTLAQMARKVIASLNKMPAGNRPARQPALRAFIRTQIGAAPGDDGVANKVLSLLQAKGTVATAGQALTYPSLEVQAQASAA